MMSFHELRKILCHMSIDDNVSPIETQIRKKFRSYIISIMFFKYMVFLFKYFLYA